MTIQDQLSWFNSIQVKRADELKLEFAFELDKAIRESRMSKKDVAEKIGKSAAWISKVLRGDANLTIETMAELSEAAGCDLHLQLKHKNEIVGKKTAKVFAFPGLEEFHFRGGREIVINKDSFVLANSPEYADAA